MIFNDDLTTFSYINAVYCLSSYYSSIGNTEQMEKYLLMAINENCKTAMINYARYHETVAENTELARKYYEMSEAVVDD